jgi:hypothetical protein
LWHPDAAPVAAMRNDIDTRPRAIKEVLMNSRLQIEFLGGETKSEATAVKAFVSSNSENALKTKPKVRTHHCIEVRLMRVARVRWPLSVELLRRKHYRTAAVFPIVGSSTICIAARSLQELVGGVCDVQHAAALTC